MQAHMRNRSMEMLFQGFPVRLAEDEDRGRFLVANSDISEDQVVLSAPAYVTAVLPTHKKRVCAWCLKDTRQRLDISCGLCAYCHYCSRGCQHAHAAGGLYPDVTGSHAASHTAASIPDDVTATLQGIDFTSHRQTAQIGRAGPVADDDVETNAVTCHGSGPSCSSQTEHSQTSPQHVSSSRNHEDVRSMDSVVWQSMRVPHAVMCPTIKRFSSFKFDPDMQAILIMCLEAIASQYCNQKYSIPPPPPPLDAASDGQQIRQHEHHHNDMGTAFGLCSDAIATPTERTSDVATPQQQQHVFQFHHFQSLCSHMETLPVKEQREWRKGARFLITAMQKAGWPHDMPTEDDIVTHCGRVLANNFGLFYNPDAAFPHHEDSTTSDTSPVDVSAVQTVTSSVTSIACLVSAADMAQERAHDLQHQAGEVHCLQGYPADTVVPQDSSDPTGCEPSTGGKAGSKRNNNEREELTGRQVFLPLSYFNHSCRPNCLVQAGSLTAVVTATEPIAAGTELNITYIDTAMPRSSRQALTSKLYAFACNCARCQDDAENGPRDKQCWSRSSASSSAPGSQAQGNTHHHTRERNKGGGHKGGGCSMQARKRQQQQKQSKQQRK